MLKPNLVQQNIDIVAVPPIRIKEIKLADWVTLFSESTNTNKLFLINILFVQTFSC